MLQTCHIDVLHANLQDRKILSIVQNNNTLRIHHKNILKYSNTKQQGLHYARIHAICPPGESFQAPSHLQLGSVHAFEAQTSPLQVGRVKEHLLIAVAAS